MGPPWNSSGFLASRSLILRVVSGTLKIADDTRGYGGIIGL